MTRRASSGLRSAPRLRRRPGGHGPLELAVLAATALLEVRGGRRDASQLDPLVAPRVSRQLTALVRRRRGGGPGTCAPTLRRVVVDASHDDRVNVVVVLDCRGRIVPVAVEVADRDGTWQVSALGAPQDHRPGDRDHHRPDWEQPASVEPW